MSVLKTIKCEVCSATAEEQQPGAGWAGWGAVQGIALNGAHNPELCPACLAKVAEFIDKEAQNGLH